jgi:hypothetical protein
VALRRGRYDDAERAYRSALAVAADEPALAAELAAKIDLARRGRQRSAVAWAALALFLGVCGVLGARAIRGRGPLRFPTEVIYAAPVFAVLVGGARFGDVRAVPSLAIAAVGSTALIGLSGAATVRDPARGARLALHVAALLLASLALLYLAAWWGGLIDLIIDTVQAGPEV